MNKADKNWTAMSLAAVGIVYGDIGTSPIYALPAVFNGSHSLSLTNDHILGVISLIFWSLMVVVSFKYVMFIMRADNKGEGGIMALIALALRRRKNVRKNISPIMLLGIFGAALFYGDGVITPAISVLSAVEGLEILTPDLAPCVIPITLLILFLLFLIQKKGTFGIGSFFGLVMSMWFLTLAILGGIHILNAPEILQALNPVYGYRFFYIDPKVAFLSLGGVVLSVTGAEALYADMGHFGRKPIQMTWFFLVFPSLILNYFGQGAFLMVHPSAMDNPFYKMVPHFALCPLIVLTTLATIIASQAVISGVFSITRQAIQLGYIPMMEVCHTSEKKIGQIYLPTINRWMMFAVMGLILGFRTSDNLASAYGICVTGTMMATTILTFIGIQKISLWKRYATIVATLFFLGVDFIFFTANLSKVQYGGWFPLLFGMVIFTLMVTWKKGRYLLHQLLQNDAISLEPFIGWIENDSSVKEVSGTAIFFTRNPDEVPQALLHNLKHNKVLHERILFVMIHMLDVPHISKDKRVRVAPINNKFYRVMIRYGFKDIPNIPEALALCEMFNLSVNMMESSFFFGRQTVIPKIGDSRMPLWQEKLFIALFKNATNVVDFFKIPHNRVIELGAHVVL